ncbi:hypothetical protein M1555_04605 [Patescibacteria group bacterium]|nr:hypothetical protein [Patescibacteria group bacterium]
MNDLPVQPVNSGSGAGANVPSPVPGLTPAPISAAAGSIGTKERESGSARSREYPQIREIGRETELPPEVARAGVRIQPTPVPLPTKLSPVPVPAPAAPAGQPPAIALPLTDDQIAQGLHQSIVSSWRWLAEWCLRKLKQVHVTIKSMGGKTVEVKIK